MASIAPDSILPVSTPTPDKFALLRARLAALSPALLDDRVARLQRPAMRHPGGILWLTGLSGAGKTTLAGRLEHALTELGYRAFMLDGDQLRKTLCADLGFSAADRSENIRRAGHLAGLLADADVIAIAAFISPYRADRERLRAQHGGRFHEVWLSATLAVCEARDAKGLYARARRGELPEFTGVSAPYEPPPAPDLDLDTGTLGIEQSLELLLRYVESRFGTACAAAIRRG
jgi:adenylyl-sulfate kinase